MHCRRIWLSFPFFFYGSEGSYLTTIPSTPFDAENGAFYSLQDLEYVVVDAQYADTVNVDGQTLIPPTLREFTELFQNDLETIFDINISMSENEKAPRNSIFVTLDDNSSTFVDTAGRPTAEGYSITINTNGITISGASPLGAWWGTRSLLQLAILKDGLLPHGCGNDAPGWATRGAMLDCGRHYYPPEFIIEMCSYLSFFKQNEFHLHLSDNLFVNTEVYTTDDIWNLYKRFRLWSDDPAVNGLNQYLNESYTRAQFEDIQKQCARRGVTVIPELEAPAHALVINKWKPELALEDDLTMLNLSHPETIPTLKLIWETFLPWFHSKTVHIGADEYSAGHTSDYQNMVNELSEFIEETSAKAVRIWGTFTPDQGVRVSQNVTIQHWALYEDNPLFDYVENGYSVINSDYSFYVVTKWSGFFAQHMNKTLIFTGNPSGGPYAPYIFDTTNATNNPSKDNPMVQGHIAAQWSDYGPLASTYLEAYYAWRNELPAMADKQWGGELLEDEYNSVVERLIKATPGQNLDRQVKSKTNLILNYQFSDQGKCTRKVKDFSGNNYHAVSQGCQFQNGTLFLSGDCYLETPIGSKGRNYSLSFSINPASNTSGTLFSGPDSAMLTGTGPDTNITLVASGIISTLNYSLPINAWTDITLFGIGGSTYFSYQETNGRAGQTEFLTKFEPNGVSGSGGVMVVWASLAIEAPLARIGEGFTGMMRNITLRALD